LVVILPWLYVLSKGSIFSFGGGGGILRWAMDGAAILGSLPEHLEMVKRYSEENGVDYIAYLDRKSGIFHIEDPRLSGIPLPHVWRRQTYEDENYETLFVNEETGERTTEFDPRLKAEELRKRGVKLEAFDLV